MALPLRHINRNGTLLELIDYILEYAYLPVYAIAVVVALWRYPRYFDSIYKYFPILLMYTFLTELLGNIIKWNDEYDFVLSDVLEYNNWLIYNIYDIIFFLYFLYVYWLSIDRKGPRNFIRIASIIFIIASLINLYTSDFRIQFQMITYFTGAFMLITSIVLYFRYLRSKKGNWFIPSNLLSWLSIGILIFLAGYLPIIVLGHFNIVSGEDYQIIRRIHLLLILIMYGCFIVGFIRLRRKSINGT